MKRKNRQHTKYATLLKQAKHEKCKTQKICKNRKGKNQKIPKIKKMEQIIRN